MNGLLLIGGKSRRMGSDKSELSFHPNLSQKERGIQLLESVCDRVFISVRNEQSATESDNSIVDAFGEIGPLGAIASAQKSDPSAAWLILACDLPLIERKHLNALVQSRHPDRDATYFSSATDGYPEPLCAIWEPKSNTHVTQAIESGKLCPRSVLKQLDGKALPSPGLWVLANTNTKADAIEIRHRINQSTTAKKISVSYFAQLRELTNKSTENIESQSTTPAGLFEEIRAKYKLPLKRKGMMVAVNGDFSDWTYTMLEGDEIVFIPPVAGG